LPARPNCIGSSNKYAFNFVISSHNPPTKTGFVQTKTGFAHSTPPISAQHQTASPYFLHSPPRPPQTPAASFKSRYRKSSAFNIPRRLYMTRLGLPINACDFWDFISTSPDSDQPLKWQSSIISGS